MSRLYEYMIISSDDGIAKFRALSIKLVKENTKHRKLLNKLDILQEHIEEIDVILSELNTNLKKIYNGNYKFDLCIDEGDTINKLKIKRKFSKKLTIECHSSNDKLSKIKRLVEINLSNNTNK